MPEKSIHDLVVEIWPGGAYAFVAWLVNYAFHVMEGKPFRFIHFAANGLIAGWLWMNVALFMEPGNTQLFVASMSGFCSMPILKFLERDGWKTIIEILIKRPVTETKDK